MTTEKKEWTPRERMLHEMIVRRLRVKIKHLAAESRIIRSEERRARNGDVRRSLHNHRVTGLRDEARHTLLTYAAVRGIPYQVVEQRAENAPSWLRIEKMHERMRSFGDMRDVKAWIQEAIKYREGARRNAA